MSDPEKCKEKGDGFIKLIDNPFLTWSRNGRPPRCLTRARLLFCSIFLMASVDSENLVVENILRLHACIEVWNWDHLPIPILSWLKLWIYNAYKNRKGNFADVGWMCFWSSSSLVYIGINLVCLFGLIKRGIRKICNFPYEVLAYFLHDHHRPNACWKNRNIVLSSFYAQVVHSSVVYTIISEHLWKEKYISKEIISVTDSWHRVPTCVLPCVIWLKNKYHGIGLGGGDILSH